MALHEDRPWGLAVLAGSALTLALFLSLPSPGRLSTASPPPAVIKIDFVPLPNPPVSRPRRPEVAPQPQPRPQPPPAPKVQALPEPVKTEPAPPVPEPQSAPPPAPEPAATTTEQAPALPEPVPLFRLSAMPRFSHRQLPDYPPAMRDQGREATVRLELLIDAQGQVRQVQVLESAGEEFDRAAILAMQASTFEPGYAEGQPVAVRLRLPVKFTLR